MHSLVHTTGKALAQSQKEFAIIIAGFHKISIILVGTRMRNLLSKMDSTCSNLSNTTSNASNFTGEDFASGYIALGVAHLLVVVLPCAIFAPMLLAVLLKDKASRRDLWLLHWSAPSSLPLWAHWAMAGYWTSV